MTIRAKLLLATTLTAFPLVAAVAITKPKDAIILVCAPICLALAARSPAYPVALSGIPTLVIALLDRDPFPHGLITVAFFGWTMLAVALMLLAREAQLPTALIMRGPMLFSILLAIDLLLRLGVSGAHSYGSTKLQLFALQNLVLLLAAAMIAQSRPHFDKLVSVTIVVAGLSGLLLIYRLSRGDAQALFDSRFSISPLENPIQLGRQAADGLIFGTYVLLSAASARTRAAASVVTPVLALALLAAGSRGPVLGAAVGLLTLFAVLTRERAVRKRMVTVVLAAAATALLASQLLPGASIQRSLSILSGSGSGVSSNGRFHLWSEAWHTFVAHPLLGDGTGSFFAVDGFNQYPHNLLLEAAAELGIVGVALVVAFLGSSLVTLVRARASALVSRPEIAVIAALFAAAATNAMFSGDMPTNSDLWFAGGLALGLAFRSARAPVETDVALPGDHPVAEALPRR